MTTFTEAGKAQGVHRSFLSYGQILAILLVPRLLSASYNIIHDTDETYNYWEPLHFLLHGQGFQTWEYSPVYAIRSWTYIALHAAPLWPLKSTTTREQQFYILRFILGTISAASESLLVSVVASVIGHEVALMTMFGLAGSAGMFVASTALLPSSFTMYTSTVGLAFAIKRRYFWATVSFATGAIVGWPFSALLFAPVFLFSFFERQLPVYSYIRGTLVSLQMLLLSTIYDYTKYRIWTIVPLNIVLYNVFASSQGRGPELFGTEPASYYHKNLLLNFNILFVLAFLALLALLVNRMSSTLATGSVKAATSFTLWFFVFTAQPHKEERFMYPVYPALVLCASIAVTVILDVCKPVTGRISSTLGLRADTLDTTTKVFVILSSSFISALRVSSLVTNYGAPLSMFPNLPSGKDYCIGADWYRFPTSFLLPHNTSLSFIESSFTGLLPGKFVEPWSVPEGMNDMNKWSADKVVDVAACDAIIDWQEDSNETHQFYFLDRETGEKRAGYYGYQLTAHESNADRLNRLGIDLFGRTLDKEGKRYEDGALANAIQRDSVKRES